jgi:hypothetical protein
MNLKKLESYLRVNLLGPGPSSYKKRIYRAAVSQRLGNIALSNLTFYFTGLKFCIEYNFLLLIEHLSNDTPNCVTLYRYKMTKDASRN